ncbi:MAG TPA: sigma-70 family RNA polymerase sigma factor [Polyangia bacterium]|nr:sigma-70 family RNA polymerase sigma factor [Polyangia bacterium]
MRTPGTATTSARSSVEPSDRVLVARCQQGDHGAWQTLYQRYAPTVQRFVSAFGVPPVEREDACQDVFMAVHRSLPRFRGDCLLSTWIYRIAVRGTSRQAQKRRVQSILSALLMREPPPPPPPDLTERTARLEVLDGLLQKVDPKKRQVLILFELEGLPIEEVARIVGCPQNTAWSRLHHGRAQLLKAAKRRRQ